MNVIFIFLSILIFLSIYHPSADIAFESPPGGIDLTRLFSIVVSVVERETQE